MHGREPSFPHCRLGKTLEVFERILNHLKTRLPPFLLCLCDKSDIVEPFWPPAFAGVTVWTTRNMCLNA